MSAPQTAATVAEPHDDPDERDIHDAAHKWMYPACDLCVERANEREATSVCTRRKDGTGRG